MKFLSLILSFLITTNLFASTNSLEGLGRVFDEYQYFLTVEWDQKDQEEFEKKSQMFKDTLRSISRDKSLSREEILLFIKLRTGNDEIIKSLEERLLFMPKSPSEDDLQIIFRELQEHAKNGASWNGSIGPIIGIIMGIIIIASLFYTSSCSDGELESQEYCGSSYRCTHYEYDSSTGASYCAVYGEEYSCRSTKVCITKTNE